MRLSGALLAVACSLLVAPAAVTAAPAILQSSVTREDAGVQATLGFRQLVVPPAHTCTGCGGANGGVRTTAQQLTITRQGQQLYSQPIVSRYCRGCELEHLPGRPALQVADLEGNGQPDAVVELNTGGTHCCTIVQVLSYDPGTMAYRLSERDFGDPGALLT